MRVPILGAWRSPIGRFGGSLAGLSAVELGAQLLSKALRQANLMASEVDLSITGLARQAGCGPNPGRQIAVKAGLPHGVPAYTLNQACASGLSAISAAARHILLEEADLVAVIGCESMSNVPYLAPRLRWGQKMGDSPLLDGMYQDGLHCPLCDRIMGETVEDLARQLGISRQQQDQYALQSQQKVRQSSFDQEVLPLDRLERDEHPRPETSLESLARLPPVFAQAGSVTAGNSSGITDGAAVLFLASSRYLERHQRRAWAYYAGASVVGLEPERMGLGPVPALRACLSRQECQQLKEYHWVEINEAFAAQVLACQNELSLASQQLNPKGGAIALGHPIGCSGARIVTTLLHGLHERGGGRGLASLCVSGGMGICAAFETAD